MKNTDIIRVAIVGCGAISELYYAPLLVEISKKGSAKVEILFDPDPSRSAALKELFPQAATTKTFSDVINLRPDLVIIASPPKFHAAQSIELLENGIAVLCEKPMSATVAEAEAMIAAAAKTKTVLAVGLFRRFFPTSRIIYDIVRGQRLGAVKHFEVYEGGQFNWPAQSASFFQKSGSQGGVLADAGVHVLDLLIWWFGVPEKVVYEDDAMGGLDVNCRIELEFGDGVKGTVRLSRDTLLPNRTIIECEQGWLRCKAANADNLEIGFPGSNISIAGQLSNIGEDGPYGVSNQPAFSYHQSFAKQLYNVFAALHGKEELLVSGEQGLLSLQLIEKCYQGRSMMPMQWLAEQEIQTAIKIKGVA